MAGVLHKHPASHYSETNITTKMLKKSSSSVLAICFVLLLLFASQQGVDGKRRVCQSLSHGFRGLCLRDHNCALICRNEAFSGGRCRGFRRRCFCTKFCHPEH